MSSRMSAAQIQSFENFEISQMHVDSERMADELQLWEWGKWQHSHGINLWYPSRSAGFVTEDDSEGWADKSLTRLIANISDDEALPIDSAISSLPIDQRAAIVSIYRDGVPVRKLAATLGVSRYVAEKALNQGLGMLWGMLKKIK